MLDTKSYGVKLEVGKTVQIEVTDREQLASLTVYKEGEVLTGAEVTEEGVTFSYTKEKQKVLCMMFMQKRDCPGRWNSCL